MSVFHDWRKRLNTPLFLQNCCKSLFTFSHWTKIPLTSANIWLLFAMWICTFGIYPWINEPCCGLRYSSPLARLWCEHNTRVNTIILTVCGFRVWEELAARFVLCIATFSRYDDTSLWHITQEKNTRSVNSPRLYKQVYSRQIWCKSGDSVALLLTFCHFSNQKTPNLEFCHTQFFSHRHISCPSKLSELTWYRMTIPTTTLQACIKQQHVVRR